MPLRFGEPASFPDAKASVVGSLGARRANLPLKAIRGHRRDKRAPTFWAPQAILRVDMPATSGPVQLSVDLVQVRSRRRPPSRGRRLPWREVVNGLSFEGDLSTYYLSLANARYFAAQLWG